MRVAPPACPRPGPGPPAGRAQPHGVPAGLARHRVGVLRAALLPASIGVGIGKLVGHVAGPGGQSIAYPSFVAPALLAASAMNGAIYDSTLNVYFKLKFAKTYDAILATPVGVGDVALGEITWALIRGAAVLGGLPRW